MAASSGRSAYRKGRSLSGNAQDGLPQNFLPEDGCGHDVCKDQQRQRRPGLAVEMGDAVQEFLADMGKEAYLAVHDQLGAIAELHEGSGLTAVLDHLAGLHAGISAADPAWASLERLAAQGAWVKLSGWYRLQASTPYEALHGHIRRVAALMGEHLVWGSDWPHTAFEHGALPPYDSLWQPVVQALGEARAAAVCAAGALLYA